MPAEYKLNIIHLYPDLLNLYGDRGNIACMERRLKWRGIDAEVKACTNKDHSIDLKAADIIFLGGGSDREQEIVCGLLLKKRTEIRDYIESDGVLVAVCGGYQLLGSYYQTAATRIEGLGLIDIYTDSGDPRLIGNVVLDCGLTGGSVVGFENHAGRTHLGSSVRPLGRVKYGNGNDGESGFEGAVYKNVIATYLHGPLFPKNPVLCDYVLGRALLRKYPDFKGLSPLDDSLENKANEYICKKYV